MTVIKCPACGNRWVPDPNKNVDDRRCRSCRDEAADADVGVPWP